MAGEGISVGKYLLSIVSLIGLTMLSGCGALEEPASVAAPYDVVVLGGRVVDLPGRIVGHAFSRAEVEWLASTGEEQRAGECGGERAAAAHRIASPLILVQRALASPHQYQRSWWTTFTKPVAPGTLATASSYARSTRSISRS